MFEIVRVEDAPGVTGLVENVAVVLAGMPLIESVTGSVNPLIDCVSME